MPHQLRVCCLGIGPKVSARFSPLTGETGRCPEKGQLLHHFPNNPGMFSSRFGQGMGGHPMFILVKLDRCSNRASLRWTEDLERFGESVDA